MPHPADHAPPAAAQRLDKWLWFARVLKSRTSAAELVAAGKVRVNRERTDKPSQAVRPGDVLTIAVGGRVRVLKVLSAGTRRGPASEASLLFEDLTPKPEAMPPVGRPSVSESAGGRPSKQVRRRLLQLKGRID